MLGIKLTDGLYDENNKPYFMSRTADSKLKTNLGYVMHQADCMAARIEYEMWANKNSSTPAPPKRVKRQESNANESVDTSKLFNDLFGEKK